MKNKILSQRNLEGYY